MLISFNENSVILDTFFLRYACGKTIKLDNGYIFPVAIIPKKQSNW